MRYFIIGLLLFVFTSCDNEYTESEKRFKGAFWNVSSSLDDLTYYDSAQFYLNKMKKNDEKEYSNSIWQLRLYLQKGFYDSILLKNKQIEAKNNYDINIIKGIAYKEKGDSINSNIFLNKALSDLNCDQELSDQCIIVKTLITNDFNLIDKNKEKSPLLYEIYNNIDNDPDGLDGLIESINSPFNDDFFILNE